MYYRPRRFTKPQPQPVSVAVHELLQREGVTDEILDGKGLRFDLTPAQVMWTPRFQVPEVDWREEERERAARERQEQALEEELPGQHPPPLRESA